MTDRPILFSGAMVRAILDGRKTQTRRVLKPQPPDWCYQDQKPGYSMFTPPGKIEFRGRYVDEAGEDHGPAAKFIKLPYRPGDRLWVRETWGTIKAYDGKAPRQLHPGESAIGYTTDDIAVWCQTGCNGAAGKWRPSIHMPRWASRLTLEVTDVRVQRVQEISEADAKAEGVIVPLHDTPRGAFQLLWDGINHKRGYGWGSNPWVCAITFRAHQQNIDSLEKAA